MSSTEIILLAAIFAFVGFRLYQKYVKKDTDKTSTGQKKGPGTPISSVSKDDDYEPYSGK